MRRLLEPLPSLPEPTEPLATTDQSILDVFNELSMVPPSLLVTLEEEPEPCPQCPLEDAASEDVKIKCAGNLDVRLRLIRAKEAGEAAAAVSIAAKMDARSKRNQRLLQELENPPEESSEEDAEDVEQAYPGTWALRRIASRKLAYQRFVRDISALAVPCSLGASSTSTTPSSLRP